MAAPDFDSGGDRCGVDRLRRAPLPLLAEFALRKAGAAGSWFTEPTVLLAALALLTALRLLVAATTNVAPDEAYYWVWSRSLQPGYLDDSPMVALFIRAGSAIAGPTSLGIRLLGPLAVALGSVLICRAGCDFFPRHPAAGPAASILINATLLLGVGSVIMTPDTPLLFFWALGLFAIGRLLASGNSRWWWVVGLAGGLALDSKYTGCLFIAAVGLWLLVSRSGRRWLVRPEPWFGLMLALLLFAPVVVWNALHHWVSFLKQGGRVGAWHPAAALRFEAELVGGQIALATPLIFVLAVAGTWQLARDAWRNGEPAAQLLSLLTLVPAALFLEHALGDRVQGNWPAVLYPSALLAGAALAGQPWVRLRAPAVVLGLVITGVVYVQATAQPLVLPARHDPALRQLGGWENLAEGVAEIGRENGAAFVAATNYGLAAELALHNPGPQPVVGVGSRWRLFRLAPAGAAIAGRGGLLVRRTSAGPPDPAQWLVLGPPFRLQRTDKGEVAESYFVYRVRARPGVVGAVLPIR
ncbi:MAG: glycosyltransferase family 39 protein [Acetobacteraceae bacterium]